MSDQYDLLVEDSQKQWYSLWDDATGVTTINYIVENKRKQEEYRRSKGIKPRKIGGMKKIYLGVNSL